MPPEASDGSSEAAATLFIIAVSDGSENVAGTTFSGICRLKKPGGHFLSYEVAREDRIDERSGERGMFTGTGGDIRIVHAACKTNY